MGTPGLINLHKELIDPVQFPHIQVTANLEKATRYGLKPGDIRRASATMMAVEEVGDVFIKDAPMTCMCGPSQKPATALTRCETC